MDRALHLSNRSLYVASLDLTKAFDSVHRPTLRNILLDHFQIQRAVVNLIELLYTGNTRGKEGGLPLSPLLLSPI